MSDAVRRRARHLPPATTPTCNRRQARNQARRRARPFPPRLRAYQRAGQPEQAFVTDEIGVCKDVGQSTEDVRGTVRHTEVEVERVEGGVFQTARPSGSDPAFC